MKKSGFYILLFLLFAAVSSAQSVNDTVQIDEIRVLAKKKVQEAGLKITRPDSVARISTITTDLSGLISDYSPVFVKSFGLGSQATASFRGTAAAHTQVLWNGMNLNSPMRGDADLSLLPVFFTDNVYLLHGGSSLAEGSGALGGSIHLQNTPDWSSGFDAEGIFQTGSFNTQKTFLKLTLGSGKFQSITRAFYESSDNDIPLYNYGVLPQRQDTLRNADYSISGVLQEFYFRRLTDRFMTLRIWYQQSDRNLPQLMSYEGSEREEYQKDQQFRIQYEWKKYSDQYNFHFFSGVNSNQLSYFRATPAFNFVNEDSESAENSFLNHFRVFREFDETMYATLSVDANYHQVDVTSKQTDTGYDADRFEASLMAALHLKPSERFAAFLLLRSENYDNKFVPLIPSAGLEWQFLEKQPMLIQVNVARNYHKPTLNDLYWLPGGNPDLLAEDGFAGDVTLSAEFDGSLISFENEITGFAALVENWIMWQPASNGAYYWEANNVKDVFSRGIEYHFASEMEMNSFLLKSGGNYSFTKTTNQNAPASADKSRGKQLIYIPKHKGNWYFTVSRSNFTIKYDLLYTGKRYTNSANMESDFERILNPYWISNLSLDKKISFNCLKVIVKAEVENLLDAEYQSILWRPMPGRYYNFSIALNLNQQ